MKLQEEKNRHVYRPVRLELDRFLHEEWEKIDMSITGWAKFHFKGLSNYNFAYVISIFVRFIAFDRARQNLGFLFLFVEIH